MTSSASAGPRPAVEPRRGHRAQPSPRPGTTPSFRADIQGLRAVAVLLVLLYHSRVGAVSGGYVGVDVFFVISGFLIISHLTSTLYRGEKIKFGAFYANRARRILPAAFTVIILTMVAATALLSPLALRRVMGDAVATVLYVPNVSFALQETNYLADTTPSLFQHFWSLGIEEQFYLLVPALLAIAFWATRRSRTGLTVVTAVLVMASFVTGLIITGVNQSQAFFLLPTRAWELGVGGLVAFALTGGSFAIHRVFSVVISWAGLGMILFAAFTFTAATAFPGIAAAVPVVGSALVILGGHQRSPGGAMSVLRLAPFQWIGAISYSLYLVHWPILTLTEQVADGDSHLPDSVYWLLGAIAVPLAWVLYVGVEQPFRRMRTLVNSPPAVTLISALTVSILLSGAALFGLTTSSAAPLYASAPVPKTVISAIPVTPSATPSSAPSAEPTPPPPPVYPIVQSVPENLTPSLADATADNAIIYGNGCHASEAVTTVQDCVFGNPAAGRSIALFGDSHAASWFPALNAWATTNGYALRTYTKSACESVDVVTMWPEDVYTACTIWRQAVIANLIADPPAAAVIANTPNVTPQDSVTPFNTLWSDGLGRTVAMLSPHMRVAVVADTPSFNGSPVDCLAANLASAGDCVPSRESVLNPELNRLQQASVAANGGAWLDMTPYLCNPDACLVIMGNFLMWRDRQHMTNSFSTALGPAFGTELRRALPNLP